MFANIQFTKVFSPFYVSEAKDENNKKLLLDQKQNRKIMERDFELRNKRLNWGKDM